MPANEQKLPLKYCMGLFCSLAKSAGQRAMEFSSGGRPRAMAIRITEFVEYAKTPSTFNPRKNYSRLYENSFSFRETADPFIRPTRMEVSQN